MTEAEYARCTDPAKMLTHLWGQVSERKLRLFACGCCRQVWDLLTDERSRRAVEVAERYADGRADPEERATAEAAAWDAILDAPRSAVRSTAAIAAWDAVGGDVGDASANAALAANAANPHFSWERVRAQQALLLRDIVGDLSRPIIWTSKASGPPHWEEIDDSVPLHCNPLILRRCWLTADVLCLTRGIYLDRAFEHLPILADALEEAGCSEEILLGHLRGPGPHVLGCWVLDLLVGKE